MLSAQSFILEVNMPTYYETLEIIYSRIRRCQLCHSYAAAARRNPLI